MIEREARFSWFYRQYQYDSWNNLDLEFDSEGEMGYDDLDDEFLFGSFRGNIVGIRYYFGIVSFLIE